MQQLHLVGFTTDHKGLIFGTRRGTEEGGFVVNLDRTLVEHIEELLHLQAGGEGSDSDRRPGANGTVPLLRKPRIESKLTPREVQAMLRAGRSLSEVADAADMSEDWVGRYAAPVLAEQERVIERATGCTYVKPRIGPSIQPLGDSVVWNLAERGIVLSDSAREDAWTAFQQPDGGWVVRVSYLSERRRQHADWAVDMGAGSLKAVNRLANELAYVEPGRRRPAALPPPAPVPASAQRASAAPRPVPSPGPQARASGRLSLLGGSPSARPASTVRTVDGSAQRVRTSAGSEARPPASSPPSDSPEVPGRGAPSEAPRRDGSTTVISTNPAPRTPVSGTRERSRPDDTPAPEPSTTSNEGRAATAAPKEDRSTLRRRSSRGEPTGSTEEGGRATSPVRGGSARPSRADRLARAEDSERPLRAPDRRPRGETSRRGESGPGPSSLAARPERASEGGPDADRATERPREERPEWEQRLLEEKRLLRSSGLPVVDGPTADRSRGPSRSSGGGERSLRAVPAPEGPSEPPSAPPRPPSREAGGETGAASGSASAPAVPPPPAESPARRSEAAAGQERPLRADRPLRTDRPLRGERPLGAERPLRSDRPMPSEPSPSAGRPLRADRPISDERPVSGDRPFAADRPLRAERSPLSERPLRADRPLTAERPLAAERPLRAERTRGGDRPLTADRPLRAQRPLRAASTPPDAEPAPTEANAVRPAREPGRSEHEWTRQPQPAPGRLRPERQAGSGPGAPPGPGVPWSDRGSDREERSSFSVTDGPITAPVPAVDVFGPDGEGGDVANPSGANSVVIRAGQAGTADPDDDAGRSGRRGKANEQPGRSSRLFLRRKSQDSR